MANFFRIFPQCFADAPSTIQGTASRPDFRASAAVCAKPGRGSGTHPSDKARPAFDRRGTQELSDLSTTSDWETSLGSESSWLFLYFVKGLLSTCVHSPETSLKDLTAAAGYGMARGSSLAGLGAHVFLFAVFWSHRRPKGGTKSPSSPRGGGRS
jgi:hypothetical protein